MGNCLYGLDVVLFCFRESGERIGLVSSEFGVVGYLGGVSAAFAEMIGDGRSDFSLVPLVSPQ